MTSPLGSVLRTPHTVYLLVTSLVGRLPTAMAALAIVQLVRLQGGDFALAGSMTAVYVVAGAIGQPLLGRWIDSAGQTLVLVVSGVAGAAGFVVMAASTADAPALGLAGALLSGLATAPLEPALRSLWPRLVPDGPQLKAAFSLDAGAQELVFIAGPLLTVLGITAFGATGNLLFAAALGLGGTLAFALDRFSRTMEPVAVESGPRRSPVRDGVFRRVVLFQFGVGFPLGMITIAVTAYGEQRGLPELAGWALSANAVGALIGATVSALRPSALPPYRLLAGYGALLALGYLPLALFGAPEIVWVLLAVLAGVMLPPTLAQVFEFVQKITRPQELTEANAWAVSAINVGAAGGTVAAGLIAEVAGGTSILWMVLTAVTVTAACSLAVLPGRVSRVPIDALK
ncbi:MFS transporter [Glaciihabitans arcticus]|uniref:MFS transporter n=1 Tax=Glaciihabitans arcticus TaxID=2668039 RepID=A0A4Q9GN46_9MICO|nr:MFS transporter [Glaciihabitans arcticus]TBN56065.1 MFS transporter [Glaciihabitans arcticus]